MRIDPIKLTNQSKLINDYRNNDKRIVDFFDYLPFENFEQRVRDLGDRVFPRELITDVLHTINENWDAPSSTLHNIKRLKKTDSVVVIGGQQAGLLTGPMYTINKVISIIQFAKQQEEELGIPVIPVFWIAGEDHDFDEINHIFIPNKSKMKKIKVGQRLEGKYSVSDFPMDKEEVRQWMYRVFAGLHETEYTKDLYEMMMDCFNKSNTYTDFFARIIFQLFNDDGLVLIDSAHPLVRKIEEPYFVQMIENQSKLSSGVYDTLEKLRQEGYQVALEADINSGNLFYHKENERILLTCNESGDWVGKQDEVVFTTEEMIAIAKHQPEKLSNNVVTRPIMQEMLFPSLTFIGGAGEIAYWATLKSSFHAMGIKMPPVLPRLSFTFIESRLEKLLAKFGIDESYAVNNGMHEYKDNWLKSKSNPPIHELANTLKQSIEMAHKPLKDIATDIRSDLGALAEKNLQYLFRDVEFLEGRIMKGLEDKFSKELHEIDTIHLMLHPDGLQERTWNPLFYMNKYGVEFIREIIETSLSFENEHYIICL
ncbi:bacillithiol biosynthesis cysteine-adding enzyme BshC [Oceanobacillus bengalensis]|uniref:Putative cysteine ligase BshC n=1 Tax=Oceanobacillus bengalensis TaxID=1435466 RepID=A0A494Z1F3_9BACI|nr:bacillithiol biosynthesis cysteine-adding enzyme BshC [Oceanobacillus bengalensis]RKQ16314.1 bacillithiol biosynthesis cysteine-adding enzyme BshC [Oceanobacillus bengalensis]